ncbi:GNAT family N-acetyltransferase [Bdellovibrio bacteriovorus]|uniref:Ribosomal protein acetyltransferase n=1 Tax=Bdellovibrio bacteriovorus TaxID=959 RepID=A0A150WL20_BDEBC|nr:GNAT family protein [Bdellovibrio bacteriovorus]KYG64596.1 ribosomal protein acetyltransferase [Bdellovibrio bacteriovorus]
MTPHHLPETIAASRVTLKKHRIELATEMFRRVDEDRERLGKFLPWVAWTKGIHDEREYIEMTHKQWADFKMFDYGVFLNDGDVYLGNVGVHTIAWEHNRCELGYWIVGGYEGQGYVSEAVKALEKVLFDEGFFRIEIRCSGANARSASVALRCGYMLEGRLRKHCIENGQRRDTLIYAKLKNGN